MALFLFSHAVTIEGTNLFGHGDNITSVVFGDIPAVIDHSASNNSRILVRVQASNNTVDTAVPIRITADTSAIVASSGAIWTFLVQGAITSNQPLEGQVGTIITINGANLLGGGNSISEIFLDGVSGTVTSNSSSSITIVMDDLMTQRPDFFPGLIYILSDTGAIVTGGNYAHRASGNITNFSPNRGRRGTTITIQGSNVLGFGTNISGIDVAGVSGTVMSFNSTTVIAAAGMGPRNQTGPIVLRINTGATITSAVNFTYDQPGVVTSVSPMMGAEGTGVSVSGAGLTPDNILLTSITVGGVPVSRVVTASNQEVSIIVGPAPLNNSDRAMILINANDGSFVDGGFFSFITFTISLNGISRGQGGTVIEINLPNATQFEPNLNLRATVDDILATTASVNGTGRRLRVSVPRARRQGTYVVDVAVEGANGVVARLRDGFTYLAEGLICTVDPAVGQPGTLITLQGDNLLGGGNSIESASVAGKPAMVRQMNNTVALLELMESSSERPTQSYPLLGDIILTADTGAVVQRLDAFSLTEPGNIAQVSPLMGQNGTMVNISGTNLLQGGLEVRSITLAGVPAVVVSNSTDTLISVQAASSAATQPLSVVITLSTGATISSRSNITFQYVARGTVSTVSPNSGAVGTRVLITGRDLLQGGGAVRTVLLGGVQAMLRGMPSNMAINVTASAGTPGLGDVVIVSDTGSTLTERNRWTTEALGTISSVSPAIGQQGFEVTVSGRSLLGAAASQFSTCLLAGVPATIVQGEFNSTAARCRAGSSPFSRMNHSGPVELVTETGVAIRSAQNVTFTYYSAYIDSVTPGSGNNGTEVTIRGLNLYNSPGGSFQLSRVLLGSIEANVTSSTNSEVSVRVDISNVSTSNEDVRIESSSGSFLVLASAWNYTIPRVILSLKPQSGLPGETVTLYGQNLVPDGATAARVIVGQTEAFNVQLINSSTIQFQVGIYQNSDLPETNLPIQLVYPSGETTFNSSVLFQYNSTYENVTSISPVAGGENARVVISGTNLTNPAAMIRRITLAGIPVTVQSASDNEIIVEAGPPPPSGTSGQLLIETTGGRLYGLAGEVWEYYPVITSGDVSPITGQNGTNVTIDLSRVSNLPAIMGVNLNGVPATDVSVNSSGTLTLRAGQSPNTPIGSIIISLATGTIVIPSAWSYQAPVTITNISPSSGYFNTLVTITGSGFQAGLAMVNDVYLARTRTAIEFQNDTMLQVRLLQETMSDSDVIGPVIILTNTGSFYSSEQQLNFTYVGVQVSSISPMSGTRGTLVTLTGVGLLAGGMNITSATLAGVPATVRSSMSSSVSFAAGALASSSNLSSIEYMMNTGARVRIMRSWRYVEPGVITSVTPTEGAMGTIVSISGSNLLGGGTRAMAVALNTRATSTILESFDNFVQVVAASSTGPLQPGSIQVISDTQAITESTSEVQFSYLEPGTISSVNPSQGQNGTVVSITGQRFHNGEGVTRVYIAGVEAAIRSIENNSMTSTITVEAGRPMDSGSFEGPVLVLSSRNTTTVSSLNFTYLSEGIIFSVVPRQGRNGTIVAIEGENLLGGGTDLQNVTLAGEAAEIINQTAGTFSTVFVRAPLGPSSSFTGDVVLVSNMNAHVRRVDGWTRTQQGVVNSVVPNQGQYGTNVTITGQNLLSGSSEVATLRFGDVPLMVESATDTTIVATVGEPDDPRAFMSESISISSDSGGSLYVDYRWEFLNQSSILSLSPPNGSSQEVIVINGTNLLGGGTTIESVIIAGIPGRVMAGSSDKQVMVMAGANELGSLLVGDLVLKSDTGALTVATWMYDEECPINMFGTAMDCEPCSEQCARCNGPTEFNCTECLNFALYIGENSTILFCVEKCPNVSTLDNVCVDACETNQYQRIDSVQNQTFCYNCSDLCDPSLGCSGPEPSQCGGCMFFRDVNQTCIENCSMDLFFEDGMRNCVPCHPQCVGGCSGPSEFECDSCATLRVDVPGVNLGDSVCRETCPNLFFLDTVSNPDVCQPCDRSCSIGCSGPTPFDCMRCRNVSIEGPNRRKMCLDACGPNYYVNESNFCLPCSNLCLAGAGCTGLGSSDCNRCSLTHAPDDRCVLECQDSTYFIRNSTRRCERCADACGTRGCTEAGPENCNSQSPFSAGPGTTALVIIIILILIAVIAVLAVIVFLMYRRRGSSAKYKFPNVFSTRKKNNEEATRYTRSAQVQSIPLASIEQEKEMQSNPLFVEEGPAGLYSEMGVDHEMDELYSDAEGHEHGMFLEKNNAVSASQDLYTDMDNLPPSKPVLEEVSASQDVYTDMEPILSKQEPTPLPALPPKPVDKKEDTDPLLPPNEPGRDEARPPIPEKAQKPPPPPPEPSGELYTDMQGGITEVFINPTADDLYVDVETPETPAAKYVPPEEEPLESDTTYEDTESVLASMDQYRNKSFGAGTRNASASVLQNSNAKSISKRQSAPALPSQPIPTRKPSTSAGTPLPPTPMHKSLSATSFPSSTSPTSTLTRPGSVISSGSAIPEEECLYDDIGGVQPLVAAPAPAPPKAQPRKKDPKLKTKKK